MLTRHERKDRLGYRALARVAARAEQSTGHRYSISRVSQVINCEKTGQRNRDIEAAVVSEINERSESVDHPALMHEDVFPPHPPERTKHPGVQFSAASEVATTTSP